MSGMSLGSFLTHWGIILGPPGPQFYLKLYEPGPYGPLVYLFIYFPYWPLWVPLLALRGGVAVGGVAPGVPTWSHMACMVS